MKSLNYPIITICTLTLIATASAQNDTAFTYQGELNQNGSPVTDVCDFQFRLYDDPAGGAQVSGTNTRTNVNVSNGRFSAELDFGAFPFDNSDRWLSIEIRCPAGAGGYTVLSPRQPITRSPYSIQTRGIVVDANKNVGIGTEEPLDELHVAGDNATLRLEDTTTPGGFTLIEDPSPTQLRISKTNLNGQVLLDLNPTPADESSNAQVRFFRQTDTTGTKVVHFYRGNNTSSPSARIGVDGEDSYFGIHGGRVGIGTTSPSERLDVIGTVKSLELESQIVKIGSGTFIHQFGSVVSFENRDQDDIFFETGTVPNFTEVRLAIKNHGNVGIGTTNPLFKLQVNGNAGKLGGGPWSSTSDIRLKKNIEPLEGALKTLLQLRGVTFEYIDPDAIHELQGERIGMIAQEVEKVIPDWVDVREDGYKTVTQRGFEALTVEALRELREEKDSEIEFLLTENEAANLKLAELQRQITDLKKIVEQLASTRAERLK